MSKREEVLDMAVHALTPLMRSRTEAAEADLFDESIDIGQKLVAKVEETASSDGSDRDELLDMGVHALSALLGGRETDRAEDLLPECMDVARAIIAAVDAELGADVSDEAREELLDTAVHVQTALLNTRPKMPADALADRCVSVAKDMIAKVDATVT